MSTRIEIDLCSSEDDEQAERRLSGLPTSLRPQQGNPGKRRAAESPQLLHDEESSDDDVVEVTHSATDRRLVEVHRVSFKKTRKSRLI